LTQTQNKLDRKRCSFMLFLLNIEHMSFYPFSWLRFWYLYMVIVLWGVVYLRSTLQVLLFVIANANTSDSIHERKIAECKPLKARDLFGRGSPLAKQTCPSAETADQPLFAHWILLTTLFANKHLAASENINK
jgi:hypothetical protein